MLIMELFLSRHGTDRLESDPIYNKARPSPSMGLTRFVTISIYSSLSLYRLLSVRGTVPY